MRQEKLQIRKLARTEVQGLPIDIYIPISLSSAVSLLGKDEEIANYIKEEINLAIPKTIDYELCQYNLDVSVAGSTQDFLPYFINKSGKTENTYQAAGINNLDVLNLTDSMAGSLYVFEIYDSNDVDSQKLLSRTFAKATDNNTYTPLYSTGNTLVNNQPHLIFSTTNTGTTVANSISTISLPNYLTKANSTGTVFLQISFFNSITAKKTRFRRKDNSLSTQDSRYIPLKYTVSTRTYSLPIGGTIELEEVKVPLTSAQAENERKSRIGEMKTTIGLGTYQPLGSGGTTTLTSTPMAPVNTPNPKAAYAVAFIFGSSKIYSVLNDVYQDSPVSCTQLLFTPYGYLTIGEPVYLDSMRGNKLTDGYYAFAYIGDNSMQSYRISGGIVTEVYDTYSNGGGGTNQS